jgi:hypothetical protein
MISNMLWKVSFSQDDISNKKLKHIAKVIFFPLSHLINISIKDNYVPSTWKIAKIVPLFKRGDSTDTTNYRPISILSTFLKVLEKAIYNQTYTHIHTHTLLWALATQTTTGDFQCQKQ